MQCRLSLDPVDGIAVKVAKGIGRCAEASQHGVSLAKCCGKGSVLLGWVTVCRASRWWVSPLADPAHFAPKRVFGLSVFQSFESPPRLGPFSSSLCLVGGVVISVEVERSSPLMALWIVDFPDTR